MTHLINCYGSIEAEIQKLYLSQPNLLQNGPKQLSEAKNHIIASIDKTNLKYFTIDQYDTKGMVQVNGLYDQLFNFGFDVYCKVRFYFEVYQIGVFISLMRNFVPFRVRNKWHRIQMGKYLLKANSSLKYGSFKIDPVTGEVTLCFNNTLTASQFQDLMEKPNKLTEYLQQQFLKGKYFYRTYIFKILHLINEIPANYASDPQLINIKVKTMSPSYQQTDQILKRIIKTMHMEYNFFYSDSTYTGAKQLTVSQSKKISDGLKATILYRKPMPTSLLSLAKPLLSKKYQQDKIEQKFQEEKKKQFTSRLIEPIVRYQNGQIPNIYSQIQIINGVNNWQVIDQGGFGVISKGWVKFAFKQQINLVSQSQQGQNGNRMVNIFTRQIVKKDDHQSDAKKLLHEKQILSKLKSFSSPFIAKFYHSEQDDYKNALLIEYCPQKSLSLLKLRNNEFMSLATKLQYLKHLAQGIKFLKDHDVYHLDIKPSNLLFGSGVIKITDFGQAYHPEVCQKNYRPGTSIPYAPPESFSPGAINFNSKIDVFSFGIVMYELLYESYPFDYTKAKYDLFRQAYSQKNYLRHVYLAPQKVMRESFIGIHFFLKYIALKCIEQDERKRPCIEWLVIILQYCINLEQQIYD